MIDLTHIEQTIAEPELIDFGASLSPFLGGPSQRLDRLGTRHAISVQMPTMSVEREGRLWIVRLIRAKQEDCFVEFQQPGFKIGIPGNSITVSAAVDGGRVLSVTGGRPGYSVREGQALTLTSRGRRFFYLASARSVFSASGQTQIELAVPLREEATIGDSVDLRKPVMAGRIMEDGWKWSIDTARNVGLSFRIEEIA
ncbi:hypothetical protein [Sphingomonas sp. Leaf242]|uniref:hypothetical protein n=1 Tax=Sphingomonas sp. Leaf242 TaxID=1736304 RepID=UPI000712989D|nr:hypothetical protein [Sphingomonas sp. Leaf242]KQO13284.1 hypothetical protein ASF09_03275 [Sphingomonas sp. Leaf242]